MAIRLKAGDTAPDWTLPTAAGGTTSLADYRGRTLVLVFTRYLG